MGEGKVNSYWIESVKNEKKEFSKFEKDAKADVCIIGGGLTGLTTAYYLSKTNLLYIQSNNLKNTLSYY